MLTPGAGCHTALRDVSGELVSCLALSDPAQPQLSRTIASSVPTVCNNANGRCNYACDDAWFDCDGSARNGCEIDESICPTFAQSDCVFNNQTRCGTNLCLKCPLSHRSLSPHANACS